MTPSSSESDEDGLGFNDQRHRSKKRALNADALVAENCDGSSSSSTRAMPTEQEEAIARRMHHAFVTNAINELQRGNASLINSIAADFAVPLFTPASLSAGQMVHIISALIPQMDHLSSKHCVGLIREIVNLQGLDADISSVPATQRQSFRALISAHGRFVGILVSSMPKWYSEVATRVVGEFSTASEGAGERWHSLLRVLVNLVPTSASVLQNAIVKMFPFKYDDSAMLLCYVSNILKVTEYVPELRGAVWGVILERAVELDVDMENKLGDLEEEDDDDDADDNVEEPSIWSASASAAVKAKKPVEDEYKEDDVILSNQIATPEADMDPTNVKAMSNKLDALISFLISELQSSFDDPNSDPADSLALYSTLLSHFTTYLLPTHRTHAIQYLFFSVTQCATECTEAYLALLIELALDPVRPVSQRQMAMQYLASYVARSRSVSRSQLYFVVSILSAWIARYIDERELEVPSASDSMAESGTRASVDMARFTMFYSVVQGFFYIFCFRYVELRAEEYNADDDMATVEDGNASEWISKIPQLLQRIVNTRFNPLKWCNKHVVMTFAKVAQREGAAYCFSIIEQNKRDRRTHTLSPTAEGKYEVIVSSNDQASASGEISGAKKSEMKQLEGYFPFDPLMLKKTGRLIKGDYITWGEVAGEDMSSDDDDEEDEDDDDDDDDDEDDDEEDEEDEDDGESASEAEEDDDDEDN
ncbi:RNA polymerase I-specific transcription initiation factor RRN3 [Myxozyma melibiosi]|uniref:RNA polymerase I-specific transcription initiation factor RRN3 n=1 Tax=Myxozyma melibiosi TaxID=54550 RepID=A0ABR1F551_9ASCO